MGVDAGNNDPVQFWRHVGAALNGRTADRVTALLRDVQLASFEAVATLVNKLAEDGQRGWLFHGVVAVVTRHDGLDGDLGDAFEDPDAQVVRAPAVLGAGLEQVRFGPCSARGVASRRMFPLSYMVARRPRCRRDA